MGWAVFMPVRDPVIVKCQTFGVSLFFCHGENLTPAKHLAPKARFSPKQRLSQGPKLTLFSQIVGDADLIEVFQKLHDEIIQNFMVDDFGIPSIGIWSLNLDLVPRHNDYLEVCMSLAVFAC